VAQRVPDFYLYFFPSPRHPDGPGKPLPRCRPGYRQQETRFDPERQQQRADLRASSGFGSIPSAVFHTRFCLSWATSFQGSLAPRALGLTPCFSLFCLRAQRADGRAGQSLTENCLSRSGDAPAGSARWALFC